MEATKRELERTIEDINHPNQVFFSKGPSKRLQHLLQHPFDFVEWQC